MASDSGENDEQLEGSHGPRECMPCRGSGRVISGLGGTPSDVPCPWCGGSGVRVADTDAQAKWPREQAKPAATDALAVSSDAPSA